MNGGDPNSLRATIEEGRFLELPLDDIFGLIRTEYPNELERLKSAYSIKGTQSPPTITPSPSCRIFGTDYDEVNRTLVSILALIWIYRKDYASFVGDQPSEVRLSRRSFDWLVSVFEQGITSNDDLYALITSVIVNDLGKSPSLAADCRDITGVDLSDNNHDMILHKVIQDCPDLVPCIEHLPSDYREDLIAGMNLAAELNFGQLAQAENVPACLAGLKAMRERPRAFTLHFLEQILDVAGAAGHVTHEYAAKLTESVFQSYKIVHEVASAVVRGEMGVRDGYDLVPVRKAQWLFDAGWERAKTLNVGNPEYRALMRLLCIGNAANAQDAEIVWNAFFGNLCSDDRRLLIQGLNVDGSPQEPAVLATYIPEMCRLAMGNTKDGSKSQKQNALAAVLRYLARVLYVDADLARELPEGVLVIERDVRTTLLDTLRSSEFRNNVDMLDKTSLPSYSIAKQSESMD